MKFLYYIRYFFYIAWNWNFQLAFFSIFHEISGEKKYNLNTVRLDDLNELTITGNTKQYAEIYQAASYYLLEHVFETLRQLAVPDGFVDLGCGKGRVLVVAAHYGFTRITGVDFAKELCDEARSNCKPLTFKFPAVSWLIIHSDAVDFKFEKNTHIIFLFNPFKETVMKQVIKNIRLSLKRYPRKIWVVYMNPQLKKLFLREGFREVYYIKKMQFVEASILEGE